MSDATTTYDIEETLTKFGFGKSDIAKVQSGQVVNIAGDTLTDRDLATMIAFKVDNAKMDAFDKIFLESPYKQESDDTIQQMVVDSTTEGDGNLLFETVKLLPKECVSDVMKLYTTFKGGDDLNLSAEEIDMFQGLGKKATQAQIEDVLGKVLQGRFMEYQQRGLEGMSPYRRSKNKDFYPGQELLKKTQKSKLLHQHAKEFGSYIESWPNGSDPNNNAKETFGWMNFNIDDKPSIALYHRIIWTDTKRNTKFLMHRTYYVSIGHNSVQQVGFAVPASDNGILLGFSSRTSTDKVTGFGGSAKRAIGSRIMGGRIAQNMEALRKLSSPTSKEK